jgi:predicted ATPase/DNA-binding CsgD family transcriptional regulator
MTRANRNYPNNLPIALSSFIGRGREIVEVKQLFSTTRPDPARLVSLIGPGGCGKSRLAIWVAAELGKEFSAGVWLVELASITHPDLVPQTVAMALGLQEQAGRSLMTALSDYLLSRELLLVLDNCEHLLGACAQMAETLLQACPHLRILTTSREPLNISGETVWTVPPLSFLEFPLHPGITPDPSTLLNYEAIRLFIERASAASSSFSLTQQNAAAVAEICQRLDGLPLAIELAAARVRVLSVEQIAQRLATHEQFHTLTGGSRTAPPRQQTLQATLDWSYALLSETERQVLQSLSVFAGGWTLEAAEAVCASDSLDPGDVFDSLSHLVDKSLVVVDKPGGQARYRLLETIRQYAQHKLADANQAAVAQDRHLEYFVVWAEAALEQSRGPEQFVWMNRFEAEYDNIRGALAWSQTLENGAESSLRLAGAAGYFWYALGYGTEGRRHLTAVLARPGMQAPTLARARALDWAARLAFPQSDYATSRRLFEEALPIWRAQGSTGRIGVADTLEMLGELATEQGDYAAAFPLFEEALSIYRETENNIGIADTLLQHGWAVMRAGHHEQATTRMEEALLRFREVGFGPYIAYALTGLGEVAIRQGQYPQAQDLLEESLTLSREQRRKWRIAIALGSLGWVALCQRDFRRMRALLSESLTVRDETGDRGGSAWCLEKLAEAAVIQSQSQALSLRPQGLQRAVRVFAAAVAIRAPLNSVIDAVDLPHYQINLAGLRSALGETVFEAAWAEGLTLTLEQATADALAEPELLSESDMQTGVEDAKASYSGLSKREREVAALIAQGRSNREIAEAMTVGLRTVETYISRILNKLNLSSRVQIATWALEKGLDASRPGLEA